MFTHDLMEPLAARLTELTPDGIDTFFYANSGAEITEAAVKLAKQATGRPNIVVVQGSFHGRTHQAMAMTTSKSVLPRRARSPAVGHLHHRTIRIRLPATRAPRCSGRSTRSICSSRP